MMLKITAFAAWLAVVSCTALGAAMVLWMVVAFLTRWE